MTDWMTDQFAVEATGAEYVPLKPPTLLVALTALVGLCAALMFIGEGLSFFGYLLGTLGSVMGGVSAVVNLRRMSDPNYISFDWFVPLLRVVRYVVLGISVGHMVVLAFRVATGGSFL
jgi:hypothetical protein